MTNQEEEHLLNVGFSAKTMLNGSVTVKKFLGGGGQGEVYAVEYKGQPKALKWYKKGSLGANPNAFYGNIKQNIIDTNKKFDPNPEFLWPIDITEWVDGTFGYVMDLRPEGYYEITEYMLCHVRFKSYKRVIDAALNIVSAFRKLHNAGYSYQDLNDGNFFINPQNGKVLICDNDNVAPDGTDTGIIGKPRYMAPEIVLGKNKPNSLSDRFSMSLILYILFCLNHPLEGKRSLIPMPSEMQEKLYGSEPIFMMDPNDDRNGPHPVLHKNSISVWPCLPDYVQNIFIRAFSKEAFQKPSARPSGIDWLKTLTRFRSEIVPCSCGNEIFAQHGGTCICEKCGRRINVPFSLDLGEYSIPAVKDTRIYRCQISVCDEDVALSPVARIVEKENSPGVLVIKNKSKKRWDAVTSKGLPRKVEHDEEIPLKDGITFSVFDATVKIKIKAN